MKIQFVTVVATCVAIAGCSETRVPTDVQNPVDAADVQSNADAMSPGDATMPMDAGTSSLVINEINATGEDWVELHNSGSTPYDLSNVRVGDSEDGGPRLSAAVTFPPGTALPAGGYLVILADLADAGPGVQTQCPMGGPSTCYHATWGISASRGETVYAVAPDGTVINAGNFPPNAVPSGQSWGRIPNATGNFGPNTPTPGATNRTP